MIKALLLREQDGKVSAAIESLDDSQLPQGNVTVDVDYSSMNYKDGMIVKGMARMVRSYPHVPGIDLAGTVASSDDPRFNPGDKVVLTGWRIGENHWGGYTQKARVNADWLVALPEGLTTRRAMALGTAGLTAAIAVATLEQHELSPDSGPVLVTGATGGVGSIAVILLSRLGYRVTASTGKADQHEYLRGLGAAEIIDRAELSEPSKRPLESERWAGCIDNVGGTTLARVLAQTQTHGSVASVGLAQSNDLHTTVLPFLLRGVNLLGIDSNTHPNPSRIVAWQRLAENVPMDVLDQLTTEAKLEHLPEWADRILSGQVRGRIVVNVS